MDRHHLPKVQQDAEIEGAEYCRQYEEELAEVEPVVEEYWKVSLPPAELTRYTIGRLLALNPQR